MASTNKTTHYELSQYVGSDKPTYLTDYNNDMSAIDTGIYNAQDKADSAYTLADTADGKADTAITNAGYAQTDASTALTRIGTMANLDTTEKTNLVGAINEVEGNVERFNLTSFILYDNDDFAKTGITSMGGSVTVATNSDGSIFKLYGAITAVTDNNVGGTLTVQTSVRPTSDITINPAGICFFENSSTQTAYAQRGISFTIATTGLLTITIGSYSSDYQNETKRIFFMPCLYFAKDFGDVPTP